MPRPVKRGLDYFPLVVDFYNDYKIMDLLEKHGPVGVTVYGVILCEVYRNGYYLAAPIEKLSANVVRIIGSKWVQKRLVSQVILDCGELGLFETTLLKHGVITSVGIQRQYATVTARNKAKKDEYWLIDEDGQPLLNAPKNQISNSIIGVSVTETLETEPDIPQKERKEKETKLNQTKNRYCVHSELNNAVESFVEYRKKMRKPVTDRALELLFMELEKLGKNPEEQIRILNQSIVNGWTGVFPLKNLQKEGKGKNQFHNFNQRDTDYDAILLDRMKEKGESEDA